MIEQALQPYNRTATFNKVLTEKHANEVKLNEANITRGVFFMKENLGRGVDFRFAQDGYSMMLNYDHYYSASNVTQMVGRSTRTQGLQAGHAFCNDSVCLDPEPGFEYLKGREKKINHDNGPKYAKLLTKNWDAIPGTFHRWLGNHFANNNWQIDKGAFDAMSMNPQLRDTLEEMMKKN